MASVPGFPKNGSSMCALMFDKLADCFLHGNLKFYRVQWFFCYTLAKSSEEIHLEVSPYVFYFRQNKRSLFLTVKQKVSFSLVDLN